MSKLSHLESLKFENGEAIVLISAKASDNTDFYAYLKMTSEQYETAKDLYTTGKEFELLNIGYVIHTEMLPEPPEFVKQYIKEEYNL